MANDLRADGKLGFESLADVAYFLQRLEASAMWSGSRPMTIRLMACLRWWRPLRSITGRVDSVLVIRPSVMEQATAAL